MVGLLPRGRTKSGGLGEERMGSMVDGKRRGRVSARFGGGMVKSGAKKSKRRKIFATGFLITVIGFVIYALVISIPRYNKLIEDRLRAKLKLQEQELSAEGTLNGANPALSANESGAFLTNPETVGDSLAELNVGNPAEQAPNEAIPDNTASNVQVATAGSEATSVGNGPASEVTTDATVASSATDVSSVESSEHLSETRRRSFVTPRFERVSTYEPLCIDEGFIYHLDANIECDRIRPKGVITDILGEECEKFEKSLMREADFKKDFQPKSASWLKEKEAAGGVNWVEGETVLMAFGTSAGNIAHFAGRLLFITNIMRHPSAFRLNSVDKVMLIVPENLAPSFLTKTSWHRGLLDAVFHSRKIPEIVQENLDSFTGSNSADVQFVKTVQGSMPVGKTTCFRKAALPAFLKGRNFIPNFEIPGLPSYPDTEDPESVPSDALHFRKDLFASLNYPAVESALRMKKKISYFKRVNRRTFDEASSALFESRMQALCTSLGYEFNQVIFDGLTFADQVKAVENSAVAIGIHGANLVNAMFMPPRSYLLEIFPFGFDHDMYRAGSGSGLQYKRFELTDGEEFATLSIYKDRRDCMSRNLNCKNFYRADTRALALSAIDMDSMEQMVKDAIAAVAPDILD